METFQSKSVISSAMVIIVAILVGVLPQLEPVQDQLLELLTVIGVALIAGHKIKDIAIAKYVPDTGDGQNTSV